jgi:DNA-binding NtrC family response regulator
MKKLVAVLERIRGTELPVVIQGETGTGKDLVARIIHAESGRAALPFVVIDCAALPVNLMESELFGAGAGAFTGQSTSRAGLLAQVGGGTVLVDQVSSLSLEAQAKLLRVLSEGRVRPLGSEEEIAVDARFLFSASRDLEAMVQEKLFRADLLHRISVLTLRVPPLRERAADVEELARAFLAEGGAFPPVEDKALALLRAGAWPGNVRQLRNILLRLRLENPGGIDAEAVARALGERSTSSLFPPHVLAAKSLTSLQEGLEREYLLFHFRRLGGDSAALCRHLGISRKQLYRRCLRYKISLRRELKGLQQAPRPRG